MASAIGRLGARHDPTTKIAKALIRLPECCELLPGRDGGGPPVRPENERQRRGSARSGAVRGDDSRSGGGRSVRRSGTRGPVRPVERPYSCPGRAMTKVLPRTRVLSIQILPPIRSTSCRARERPTPKPPRCRSSADSTWEKE